MSKRDLKVWVCKSCSIYFEPKPPNYQCPSCKGNTTYPAREFDEEKHVLWEPQKLEKIYCSKCGGLMASGYIVEKNFPLDISTLGEGIYWTPDEWGTLGTRVSLKSYACPKCGNVEIKLRRSHQLAYVEMVRDHQFKESVS